MSTHRVTKKEFKERCDFHVYKGTRGGKSVKTNAIYFDHQFTDNGNGFKYAVAMEGGTKKELFDALYDWVCEAIALPYYIRYRVAVNDKDRFKVAISLNF